MAESWEFFLKKGDKVIVKNICSKNEVSRALATVIKVTPKGQVLTDYGRYAHTKLSGEKLVGIGGAYGQIVPYTENFKDRIKSVVEYTIQKAKSLCFEAYRLDEMSYEDALKIIEILERRV